MVAEASGQAWEADSQAATAAPRTSACPVQVAYPRRFACPPEVAVAVLPTVGWAKCGGNSGWGLDGLPSISGVRSGSSTEFQVHLASG